MKRSCPEGRLSADDDGELRMAIAADRKGGVVRMAFQNPVTWFAVPPDQARQMAEMLIAKANEIDGGR